ncbi:MAG: D-2-hydroxyacid dehydrogenase [Planctomycetes bacterium]|nr:D-2-hydroxyacid dehydrogenase [Planctomycetota bacterium]MCC7169941.1 D-2-hydroxyacid dehydrogenase [Planctomycetota bacterium]
MNFGTNLLVLGRDADVIAAGIDARDLGIDVRAREFADVAPSDLADRDMLLAFRIPATLAEAAGGLRWVQSTGAGVDGILACPTLRSDVLITRLVGVFERHMAEYVLARCLAIAQRMSRLEWDRREKRWAPFHPRLLRDLRITVLGVGVIGAAIARMLREFGSNVVGVSRTGQAVDGIDRVVAVEALSAVLPVTDVLVVVVPNTARTRGLLDRAALERLPAGAWVVNVARGSVIDEDAMIDLLRERHLGGAALDVFRDEPLPRESPLWEMEDVMVSPHVAGLTTPDDAIQAFVENWQRLARGETPVGVVDRARGY